MRKKRFARPVRKSADSECLQDCGSAQRGAIRWRVHPPCFTGKFVYLYTSIVVQFLQKNLWRSESPLIFVCEKPLVSRHFQRAIIFLVAVKKPHKRAISMESREGLFYRIYYILVYNHTECGCIRLTALLLPGKQHISKGGWEQMSYVDEVLEHGHCKKSCTA
jgi:hypothetical protein